MSIPLWVIVGLIAGWLATRVVPEDASGGMLQNLIVGVVGALAGGWIFHTFGRLGGSSVGAFTGAVVSLWILRALTRSWARGPRVRRVIAAGVRGSGNDVTTLQGGMIHEARNWSDD